MSFEPLKQIKTGETNNVSTVKQTEVKRFNYSYDIVDRLTVAYNLDIISRQTLLDMLHVSTLTLEEFYDITKENE